MSVAVTRFRRRFFGAFEAALPNLAARLERGNESSRWLSVAAQPIIIAHYVSAGSVGIFVRAERGAPVEAIRPLLRPKAEQLARELETAFERKGIRELLWRRISLEMGDEANWPLAFDWFAEWSPRYEVALKGL
jgi:hypothetical protein